MLSTVDKDIFLKSKTIRMTPVVSAEWNQNLFNAPYFTVAGNGIKVPSGNISLSSGSVSTVVGDLAKPNFDTKSFAFSGEKGSVTYNITATGAKAYKVITYVKTDTRIPVMISTRAKGTSSQFGSSSADANLFGWTKIETYIGSSGGVNDNISSFTYTLSVNTYSSTISSGTVYFTMPEFYETTYFDYQHHALWPTDDVFSYFRPGESYVNTGSASFSFPTNYRKMSRAGEYFMPTSCILQNPTYIPIANPFPNIKNVVASDMNYYKYFVSDTASKNISAIYEKNILTNKIVIKFNTIESSPTVRIYLDGNLINTPETGSSLIPDSNGLLTLYWNGSFWTKTKWETLPGFNEDSRDTFVDSGIFDTIAAAVEAGTPYTSFWDAIWDGGIFGSVTMITQFKSIRVEQISSNPKTPFNTYSNISQDIGRMQIVEISPRLELDLSPYVVNTSINKSLDSSNNAVPISSIEADDASITLSGIPLIYNGDTIPLFSSQSNNGKTILANMLRKNIKLYIHYNLKDYSHPFTDAYTPANTIIPGGTFYVDSWSESDVDTVSIQSYDVARFLQSTPAPDYVSNLKTVFEVISNVLELAGFTDYDYDSLYDVCNDKAQPLDLSYFYCNSKDSTLIDILGELFLAYQIGAYIDEYGIMKFLSLSKILEPKTPNVLLDNSVISDGGYSVENGAKIGKVSVRYQAPKIRQSPAMQNITDPTIGESPSFIYTTANTVVWSQESVDSVGFNYLTQTMEEDANKFILDVSDLLDIFHTFSLNSSGYVAIENEIVSFDYKEYSLTQTSPAAVEYVSVKNDLELASAINAFTKKNQTKLLTSTPVKIINATGNGSVLTFTTTTNDFKADQKVIISGVRPSEYNISGRILSASPTSFTISGSTTKAFDAEKSSKATATIAAGYDIRVTPTGNITNLRRGLFGSKIEQHLVPANGSIAQKNLYQVAVDSLHNISTSSACSIYNQEIQMLAVPNTKALIFPAAERDIVFGKTVNETYGTYSTKIKFVDGLNSAAGGLFFNMPSNLIDTTNTGFVELVKYKTLENKIKYLLAVYYYDGFSENIIAWADVTGTINTIINNFEKTFVKVGTNDKYSYETAYDETFHLKIARWYEPTTDNGEEIGDLMSVFINNFEINNWQVPRYSQTVGSTTGDVTSAWQEIQRNEVTILPKKVFLPFSLASGTIFGAYMTTDPVDIDGIVYQDETEPLIVGYIREIYTSQKPLRERSVNYYFQDKEFLNSMVQNQNLFASSKSYMMQVKPSAMGINYYDVQYMTPAATTVDVNPIQYLWQYFPGTGTVEQKYYQKQLIDEYSLAYSTVLNTGFRARMAIANNKNHLIFMKHDADQVNQFTNVLTLWTHEVIAPSDPEIIERVIDQSNSKEVAQIDSNWIQSKDAAEKLLYMVSKGIDGFSQKISLKIFGNPLIQVGDTVLVSYPLAGVVNKKCFVHSVSHSFDNGLETTLSLNGL